MMAGDGRTTAPAIISADKSKILRQKAEDFTVGSTFPSNLDNVSGHRYNEER